jgi:hypothetical protein
MLCKSALEGLSQEATVESRKGGVDILGVTSTVVSIIRLFSGGKGKKQTADVVQTMRGCSGSSGSETVVAISTS